MSPSVVETRRLLPELVRRFIPALVAAAALSACSGVVQLAGDVTSGPAPGEAIKMEAADNIFKPEELTLTAGETVTIEVSVTGRRPHDWTVNSLNLSTGVMAPGAISHLTFTVPNEDFEFVCTLHRGMDGTIEVKTP